jgi:hypothetical protein
MWLAFSAVRVVPMTGRPAKVRRWARASPVKPHPAMSVTPVAELKVR